MKKSFSWRNFDRMSKAIESIGYVVLVFGPIFGISVAIFGSSMFRMMGFVIAGVSFLIAMYHFSFSLLMNGIKELLLMYGIMELDIDADPFSSEESKTEATETKDS
jgi:hypothetical protein